MTYGVPEYIPHEYSRQQDPKQWEDKIKRTVVITD